MNGGVSERRQLRAALAGGTPVPPAAAAHLTVPDWVRRWDRAHWAKQAVEEGSDEFARSVFRATGPDSWEEHRRNVAIVFGRRQWQLARRRWASEHELDDRGLRDLLAATREAERTEVSDVDRRVRT